VNGIRSVYFHEPSPKEIERRIADRPNPWFANQTPEIQHSVIETQRRYGLEIKRQAEAFGLPILESRPFDTLIDRALAALDLPVSS